MKRKRFSEEQIIRMLKEAARRYNRIVQFGNRNHGHGTGETKLEHGDLGKILIALFQYEPGPMVIDELAARLMHVSWTVIGR